MLVFYLTLEQSNPTGADETKKIAPNIQQKVFNTSFTFFFASVTHNCQDSVSSQ